MERGIKLATYFIATVTKNSYEFKDLLHLAEHNKQNVCSLSVLINIDVNLLTGINITT